MRTAKTFTAVAATIGLSFGLATAPAYAAALSIGSYNVKRGGDDSLASSGSALLRKAITKAFKGSTFAYTGKLTPAFLSKVKVVVLGVAFGSQQEIMSLSTKEQAALLNFVKSGGTALLFADNDIQFQDASTSLVAVFGLAVGGVLDGAQTANFVTSNGNPIQNGPFGTATQFDTNWPGWFTSDGAATEIAELQGNGEPEIAYLPAASLAKGSGPVVVFADTSALQDNFRTQNDLTVILNSLSLTP